MSVRTPTLDVAALRAPSLPANVDAWLWAVAILAFGVGDTATTAYGLAGGFVELNPAMHGLVGHGLLALVAVKLAAFAVAGCGAWVLDDHTWIPPAVFACFGAFVLPWNLLVLSGVIA